MYKQRDINYTSIIYPEHGATPPHLSLICEPQGEFMQYTQGINIVLYSLPVA
jgi:hypothetical protein